MEENKELEANVQQEDNQIRPWGVIGNKDAKKETYEYYGWIWYIIGILFLLGCFWQWSESEHALALISCMIGVGFLIIGKLSYLGFLIKTRNAKGQNHNDD